MAFTLTSPAFLEWSDPPENARGFALIMDDPDAPNGTFTQHTLATARLMGRYERTTRRSP